MKSIANRTAISLILACVLLFGLLTFGIRYAIYSDRWVSFIGNPHIYRGGELNTGLILDRSGEQLFSSANGKTYAADPLTRRSTLHLLGDREGNIPALILRAYTPYLIGFDKLNGTYATTNSGGELRLTVSAQVQNTALQAMNGQKGAVGVYNYKTGEILCALSTPVFDPDFAPNVEEDPDGRYDGVYVYRFFNTTYTPGSIFKLVTTAAALENIPGFAEETFTCTGSRVVNGELVTCPKAHGELKLSDALAKSCNCTYAEISLRVGAKNLEQKAREIGVADSLSVDGLHTAKGNFDLSGAGENDLAWAGIGQYTDLINPCQYMTFMGAIANGGKTAQPYLVSSARCGGNEPYSVRESQTGTLLSGQAARTLRSLMRNNVQQMYAAVNLPGVEVCAKSGTAEVGTDANTATFAGFIDDPAYPLAFIVIVEQGGAGSTTCAPIAAAVLQAAMNVMDAER